MTFVRKLKKWSKSPYKVVVTSGLIAGYIYICLGVFGILPYVTEIHMTSLNNNMTSLNATGRSTQSPLGGRTVTENDQMAAKLNAVKVSTNTHNCSKWFENSMQKNIDVIKQYPRGQADEYLSKIIGETETTEQLVTSFPVIVTAANSRFYGVSQGLLQSIHTLLLPKYKNIQIIYYDMGLTFAQQAQLKKYCKCEVRTFPFDKFPPHVRNLKTYTWKPLIVKMLLSEYKWVWWMDSSVRFTTDELDSALSYSKDNSHLFFTYGMVLSVAEQTDTQTMKYLGEDTCKFRHLGEVEATFMLFYSDYVTDIIIDQWAACALNEDCMAPRGSNLKLGCNVKKKWDGRCHRFDQSVIGILLRRLYHEQNDYPIVNKPFHIHVIKRGASVSYFPA